MSFILYVGAIHCIPLFPNGLDGAICFKRCACIILAMLYICVTGPDAYLCDESSSADLAVTAWMVFRKVQLAVLLWGIGTAIGELPPYFMARAGKSVMVRHWETCFALYIFI